MSELTSVQQAIVALVTAEPGRFNRSSLAKFLVGSRSARLSAELVEHPQYGCLKGYGRKAVTFHIDVLLQQGYLGLDAGGRVVAAAAD
ncbi:MAG: hypothetical protein AB1791_10260 [Chloroflexota bacterium]